MNWRKLHALRVLSAADPNYPVVSTNSNRLEQRRPPSHRSAFPHGALQ